jgi:hypothetical protein
LFQNCDPVVAAQLAQGGALPANPQAPQQQTEKDSSHEGKVVASNINPLAA